MRRINIFDVVELGESLKLAARIDEKNSVLDAYFNVHSLRSTLTRLANGQLIELGVADHYVKQVTNSINVIDAEFEKWRNDSTEGKETPIIDWMTQYDFKKRLEEFRTVLAAESRSASTYFVAKVGIYSTNDLIENADHKFSGEIRNSVCQETLIQYRDSARCLAFGLHTACAFHMMRAIEATLLKLMKILCGKNFTSLNANWGAYIAEIEKINNSRGKKRSSKETVDLLRQIKDNHRNPVMHTEVNLGVQEALDIFDLGSVVVSHLTRELSRLQK